MMRQNTTNKTNKMQDVHIYLTVRSEVKYNRQIKNCNNISAGKDNIPT